ncbi:MAG: hypothetical protein ABH840_03320 [Nanoarchaeota archaeon]
MKARYIIFLAVAIILIVGILIMNFIGFYRLNEPLNKIVAGSPNKKCTEDSDCVLIWDSCFPCGCGNAVNKDWKPYCPFDYPYAVSCEICPSFNVKCVDNKCTAIMR